MPGGILPAFDLLFGVLLLVYLGYAIWSRLEARWLVLASVVGIAAAEIAQAVNLPSLGDAIAADAALALGGGIGLVVIERLRASQGRTPSIELA
jgi:hypothetical protein